MSNDVLITPASRKIEFKDSSGNVDAKLETDASGNLQITNAGGDISIGDTTSDVIIGDGTNNVDIVFEQNGEIRGTSGVTLTLGDSNTTLRTGTDLDLNNNDITNLASLPANFYSSYRRDTIDSSSEDFNSYLTTGTYAVNNWPESGDTVANGPTNLVAGNAYGWGVLRVTNWMAPSGTSSGTGTYVLQEYWPHQLDIVYSRIMWNGDFTSWRTAWGSENDGSGSGLDADKVDGIQGASLLRSDANDTASGIVTFSNTSNATSTTTGAVRITGGLGVGYNIYSGGLVRSASGFRVVNTTVIDSSRNLLEVVMKGGTTGARFEQGSWIYDSGNKGRLFFGTGNSYYKTATAGGKHLFMDSNGTTDASADVMFDASGNGHFAGNVTAYSGSVSSDARLKKNIRPIESATETVKQLNGVVFDWKKTERGTNQLGFIAQEVEEILPSLVTEVETLKDENTKTHKTVNYAALVPMLVESIKEQSAQIDAQQEQINKLTTLVNELKEK